MQMISSIVLLVQGQIELLRVSLLGSLLANILLLPAVSIFYAAYRRKHLAHNCYLTKNYNLLLSLAVGGFTIPTVFDKATTSPLSQTAGISRGVSIILMVTYGAYFYLQLSMNRGAFDRLKRDMDEKADELPMKSIRVASAVFVVATVLLYLCVDFVVNSVQELGKELGMFTGFVLIPILNCDLAAVEQAGRSMDLMLMFTVGKCVQSALLVAPLLVVVAWGMGADDLNLSFDSCLAIILFMAVWVLNTLVAREVFDW